MVEDAKARLAARLRELKEATGLSLKQLEIASSRTPRRHPGQEPIRLAHSTIGDMISLADPGLPKRPNVEVLVDTCLRVIAQKERPLPAGFDDRRTWDDAYRDALEQAADAPPPRPAARAPRPSAPEPPYRGLESFRSADARYFFGRDELVGTLLDRAGFGGLLVVTGASGSGKSSVLRAGLLPALARGSGRPGTIFEPGADPVRTLCRQLGATHPDELAALARRAWAGRVVVVDQFEEVFAAPEEQRRAFIGVLAELAEDGGAQVVVLGLRADFFGQCAAHPALVPALERPVVVAPMDRPTLLEVIEAPASVAGLTLQDGLADLLLEDLRSDRDHAEAVGVLPLLSHALRETWNHREDTTLTLAGYRATGGISGSLAQTADAVVDDLDPADRRTARNLLTRLVQVGADTPDTARRLPLSDLVSEGAGGPVLDHLVRARLVTVDAESAQITHEALIRGWPRLRIWLEEDRADLLARQELTADAVDWDRNGRDPAYLYSGTRLINATTAHDVSSVAAEFLTAGRRAALARRRRSRATTTVLATLLVVSLIAAISAIVLYRDATEQAVLSLSRQLSAQAMYTATTDPVTALRLAATAWSVAPTPETRQAMLHVLANPLRAVLPGHTFWVQAVAFAPGGRIMATGGDTRIILWSTTTHDPVGRPLSGHKANITSVAFSRDGGTLASGDEIGTARLWNAATGQPLGRPIDAHSGALNSVALTSDGTTLATAGDDGTVRLWNTSSHEKIATFDQGSLVFEVAFDKDGRVLAAAAEDGTTRLWDVAEGRMIAELRAGPGLSATSAAFSPDGGLVATGHVDGVTRLWNAGTGDLVTEMTGQHEGAVNTVDFSPDGDFLATGGADWTARLWNVGTGAVLGQPLDGHGDEIFGVAFSPDGRSLATASADQTTRVWDVSLPRLADGEFGDHDGQVNDLDFSPDGATLASAGYDGSVRLWKVASRERIGAPLLLPWEVNGVDISRDGRLLAAGAGERQIVNNQFVPGDGRGVARIWDLDTHAQLVPDLAPQGPVVTAVAFSPDSRNLATAGFDNMAHLWDVATGQEIRRFTGHRTWLRSVAFSPGGETLATGGLDSDVRLWRTATGAPIGRPIMGSANWVKGVAFSPDGKTVAAVSDDKMARLWDVATQRQRGRTLVGHALPHLYDVAFSSDGETVATVGDDQTVRLWDVSTQEQIAPPIRHPAIVFSVAFSPDGTTLATGAGDGRIRLWDVTPPPDLLQLVCQTAGRSFTPGEWAAHLPADRDFQQVC
ncbi:nSTAND1 domain-containing NTPase [Herbidospora mongoliensis]|uniref:nSTAND1 domain-containing NTPase n=1 Tax=Herbidospora mongoliensis TaxID=688067 RepID=UPI0008324BAD|nr:hypothetical protein [Herbidospora mongoliensis]